MDLLSLKWWFGVIPVYDASTLRIFFIVFLSIVIVGAVVRMISKRNFRDRYALEVTRRVATMLVVMGVLGLWYWFVSGQMIPFMSAHFWLVVWVLGILYWTYTILRYALRTVPKEKERTQQCKDKKKYMN